LQENGRPNIQNEVWYEIVIVIMMVPLLGIVEVYLTIEPLHGVVVIVRILFLEEIFECRPDVLKAHKIWLAFHIENQNLLAGQEVIGQFVNGNLFPFLGAIGAPE
jgi:hypothetical protein